MHESTFSRKPGQPQSICASDQLSPYGTEFGAINIQSGFNQTPVLKYAMEFNLSNPRASQWFCGGGDLSTKVESII